MPGDRIARRLLRQSTPANPPAGFDALFSDTDGKLITVDSSGVQQILRKGRLFTSTAYTNATTTATNIGGLSASLTAGDLFLISGWGQWSVSALTGPPQTALFLGAASGLTASLLSYRFTMQNAVAGTPTTFLYTAFAPSPPTSANPGVASTQFAWEFTGFIKVNAAGSLNMQARLINTGSTLTVATGSVMLVEQIG